MEYLQDGFDRRVDYLRISVTDRCNLRCIYCMPPEGISPVRDREILTNGEIAHIVRIAAGVGIRKVRLTGGEPLMRPDLPSLVEMIASVPDIDDISITTNGILLKRRAAVLAAAGLLRVNVSLDSLRPERYRAITRRGDISDVFAGLDEAAKANLLPIKINMIPIRGVNDDEIEDFARLTKYFPYHVRFIEFMPIAPYRQWGHDRVVATDEVRERIAALGPLVPVASKNLGPARYLRIDGAPGSIGFISPVTRHFCASCNRLRLTCEGKLMPCLFSDVEIDVRASMRREASGREIARLLRLAVARKPEGHFLRSGMPLEHLHSMSRIGG